jgi:hypothetical protein
MLKFKAKPCLANVRDAETADLLDRATAYREGLEPEAAEMIDAELRRRGVTQGGIDARAEECRRECLFDADGIAFTCSKCRRPAVGETAGWHRLWRILPLFRTRVLFCKEHMPGNPERERGIG